MLPFERCRRCKFRKSEVFPSCFAGGDSGYDTCHNFIDKRSFEPTIFLRNENWYGTVRRNEDIYIADLKDLISNQQRALNRFLTKTPSKYVKEKMKQLNEFDYEYDFNCGKEE